LFVHEGRLGDDGSRPASEQPKKPNTTSANIKPDVGVGRIQNQRLFNRRDSTGTSSSNRTPHRSNNLASAKTIQAKKGSNNWNEKRRRGQFDDVLDGSAQSLLFDLDYFDKMFSEGRKAFNYGKMDDVDKLVAYTFQESFKSRTDDSTIVLEAPSLKKTVLPRARTMKELYAFMQPDIQSVPEGSPGHLIAVQCWPVSVRLSQNHFETIQLFDINIPSVYHTHTAPDDDVGDSEEYVLLG